jgi:hypothetical protein
LQLLCFTLLENFRLNIRLANLEISEKSIVVNSSDKEENLSPSQRWNGAEGGNTIGDFGARKAGGNVKAESIEFREHKSETVECGKRRRSGNGTSEGYNPYAHALPRNSFENSANIWLRHTLNKAQETDIEAQRLCQKAQ